MFVAQSPELVKEFGLSIHCTYPTLLSFGTCTMKLLHPLFPAASDAAQDTLVLPVGNCVTPETRGYEIVLKS